MAELSLTLFKSADIHLYEGLAMMNTEMKPSTIRHRLVEKMSLK